MNCDDHKKDNNQFTNQANTHNHGLLMIVLCFFPMGVIFLGPLLDKIYYSQSNPLFFLYVLFCPLMHILMMFSMRKKHDHNK